MFPPGRVRTAGPPAPPPSPAPPTSSATWSPCCEPTAWTPVLVGRGKGLEIRELASQLAISNPDDTAAGRVYISYANGDVSVRRVTWDYLGPLEGFESSEPDHEPGVDAATIIATLTGEPAPRQPTAPTPLPAGQG